MTTLGALRLLQGRVSLFSSASVYSVPTQAGLCSGAVHGACPETALRIVASESGIASWKVAVWYVSCILSDSNLWGHAWQIADTKSNMIMLRLHELLCGCHFERCVSSSIWSATLRHVH